MRGIIGAEELNGRVRNGIGCCLFAKAPETLNLNKVVKKQKTVKSARPVRQGGVGWGNPMKKRYGSRRQSTLPIKTTKVFIGKYCGSIPHGEIK